MIVEKSINKLPQSAVELTVTVHEQALNEQYSDILKTFVQEAHIPGFRKGHTPTKVIERKFNEAIADETKQKLMDKALQTLFQEPAEDFPSPYSQPQLVSANDIELDKAFTFTIKYDTFPEVNIGDLTSETLDTYKVEIQKSDIDARLRDYQEQNSVLLEKTPAIVEADDVVTFDYVVLDQDGQEIAETKRKEFVCTVAEGKDQYNIVMDLVGMKPAEEKTIEKQYPEDYSDSTLANSTKQIKVRVSEIKRRSVPDIDDDLAQDISEKFKTLDDLKQDIQSRLGTQAEHLLQRYQEQQLMAILIDKTSINVPDSMVAQEIDATIRHQAQNYGQTPEKLLELLTQQGTSIQTLMEDLRPQAVQSIKKQLISGKLIEQLSIKISDDALRSYVQEQLATDTDIEKTMEEYKAKGFLENIRYSLAEQEMYKKVIADCKKKDKGSIAYTDMVELLRKQSEQPEQKEEEQARAVPVDDAPTNKDDADSSTPASSNNKGTQA